jgi:hypothetical protein
VLNITGADKLSVRQLAHEFGRLLGREALITGEEAPTAWLADAGESIRLFGPPETPLPKMMELVAAHVGRGGRLLGKPTHFETRSGKF